MRLQAIQKKMKISQKDFADYLGVSRSWITSYYYGKIRNPGSEICNRIIERLKSAGYDIDLPEIMDKDGRNPNFNRYG